MTARRYTAGVPADFSDYVEAWRHRWADDAVAARGRAAELRAVAERLGAVCHAYGANRVVLFGSVARGRARPGADIDLAVGGVAPERFFDLYGRLLVASPAPVDLVELDDCPESLLAGVLRDGVEL